MKHDRKDVAEKFLEARRLINAGDATGQQLLAQILRDDSLFIGDDFFAGLARHLAAELHAPSSAATLNYKVELKKTDACRKKWERINRECDLVEAAQKTIASEGVRITKALEKVAPGKERQAARDIAAYKRRTPAWLRATDKK